MEKSVKGGGRGDNEKEMPDCIVYRDYHWYTIGVERRQLSSLMDCHILQYLCRGIFTDRRNSVGIAEKIERSIVKIFSCKIG